MYIKRYEFLFYEALSIKNKSQDKKQLFEILHKYIYK